MHSTLLIETSHVLGTVQGLLDTAVNKMGS